MHFPYLAIILFTNEIVTQELILCHLPRINSKCDLTCKTPNLKGTISFRGQGNTLGSCAIVINQPVCQTFNDKFQISVNKSVGETNLTIKSLDRDENEGPWYCEYDNRKSETKMLRLYDIIYNTSKVNITVVNEKDDLIGIHFQTDCLMPEPSASLKCKNDEEMCKVLPFENWKCPKPNLRIYNVTCNTTAECFLRNKPKAAIKVNGYIIDEKVIPYPKELKQITEDNDNGNSSNDGISIMFLLPIIVIVSLIIIAAVVMILKHKPVWGKVSKCGKKGGSKSEHNNHLVGQDEEVNSPLN